MLGYTCMVTCKKQRCGGICTHEWQHDPDGPAGKAMSLIQLEETTLMHSYLQNYDFDMNAKVNTSIEKFTYSKSASVVSDLSPEAQSDAQMSCALKKAAFFGKRSNCMRRNLKADVSKQGWLYKQASSGVKQWNKRWFVLTERSLFYYKDEREDCVLGSLPLFSFRISRVEPADNITRKFAFKVWLKEECDKEELKNSIVFCMQAEHAGTKTYYFSADSHEEQEEWITAMSEATEVIVQPTQRTNYTDTTGDLNKTMVTPDPQKHPHPKTHNETETNLPTHSKINEANSRQKPFLSTHHLSDQQGKGINRGEVGEGEDNGRGPGTDHAPHHHHPNGWGSYGPANIMSQISNDKHPLSRRNSGHCASHGHSEGVVGPLQDPREQQEKVVLRRGFVPRTSLERVAQRKSSMAQLQQWVNQRRGMVSQDDSPSQYYPVNRVVSADYCGYPGGPQYVEDFPMYPSGVRPDSICSVSAVEGYDRGWTSEKRHSLRDGPHQLYAHLMPRDPWGAQCYGGMETSMRRLSIQPRSRSVPRSSSSSSGGPYSPVPPHFASPARSLSARFPGKMRDDVIYADPSIYSLRRSLGSPKYDYSGDRRSLNQGLYHHNYPVSPSIQNKMEDILDRQLQRNLEYLDEQLPRFHDVYSRELYPTLKLNEIETSKLLSRLCEQNRILKDHKAVVHRLRMDKDNLEEVLVATHREMELYHNQPLAMEKLQFKKGSLQSQLINIRGELSQASSALTTTRMEFEALEDEANAIHGDLWEQLNAGGQERPKSAIFPAEMKSKMSIEEQNERIRRNQSSSVREKRRSLNISGGQSPANYKVVRRRLTAHEIDIKEMETAVRGQGQESPREEIARLRRLQMEPQNYDLDVSEELVASNKILIPERYLDEEDTTPLSPEEQKEKQKKLERIKTLIAKSNLQNMVPPLDGPVEGGALVSSQQQLQEQEKRIEISCALAAEASRRSRILSAQCAQSTPTSPPSLAASDFPNSAHIMKV
ncbi:pleckstrin homology domain-containing family A member 6 isoform X13 [Paralichthys olivaceus]|uniref:pleckstrin homology domain-containing family A member 6 isoform X13 n=1 Tax=Paralichthys olivaceus TaxID=8255 RepID=UPI00375217FD